MGAVAVGSKALIACMTTGQPTGEPTLGQLLASGKGTPNQRMMAAAAALFSPSAALAAAGAAVIDHMLSREEAEGPRPWELLCPDPHEGMYLLARLGVIAAGVGARTHLEPLSRRMAGILSQELRLADLVASPDGDCKGLPGVRAPLGAALGRRALSSLWIEVRRRQEGGEHLVHRGTGGRRRELRWKDGSDPLVDGPACWAQKLLDGPAPLWLSLGPAEPLPGNLRLPLTVYRWSGGSLASLFDPGDGERPHFAVRGSAAAKRMAGIEKPTTWIQVNWLAPGKHRTTAGLFWETKPPAPPAGAERTVVGWHGQELDS